MRKGLFNEASEWFIRFLIKKTMQELMLNSKMVAARHL